MTSGPLEVTAASPARNKARWGAFAVVLAITFAGWNLSSWPTRLRYPGEQADIEGMRLAEMVHFRQGIPIYARPSAERFDAAIYGPLYYLLGVRLIDTSQPAYFALRLVSALATLGCAAGCGLLAYWIGKNRLAAVLAPLLFLSYGFVARLGASARADSLAVLLASGGLLIAYRFQHRRAILCCAPLMLAAFFYKQQYVAGPLAVALFLLLQRRRRDALQFMALMMLGVFAMLGTFQFVIFPGQEFLLHFLAYNRVPLSWPHFVHAGLLYFGLVLLIPTLMGLEFLRARRDLLLSCYLGCAGVLSLILVAKAGSDTHYWFECILILSALVPALVAERIESGNRPAEVIVLLGIACLVARFFVPAGPRPEDFARDQRIQEFLRGRFPPGTRVLTRLSGDVIRAGLDVPISDLDQYLYLARTGTFSVGEQEAQLRAHRFGAVLLNFDIQVQDNPKVHATGFPKPWVAAILERYEEIGSLEMPDPEKVFSDDRFRVWVPRSRPPEAAGQSAQ